MLPNIKATYVHVCGGAPPPPKPPLLGRSTRTNCSHTILLAGGINACLPMAGAQAVSPSRGALPQSRGFWGRGRSPSQFDYIKILFMYFNIINIMFKFAALLKYVLEGLAVALAAFYIPQRKVDVKEIVLIALTAAAVFSILDQFSPLTGISARQGAGFGIGLNQVGWGHNDYGHYGGADPHLSCTCEIDADYLRSQLGSKTDVDAASSTNVTTTNITTTTSTTEMSPSESESPSPSPSESSPSPADNLERINTVNNLGRTTSFYQGSVVEAFDGFGQTW